MKLLPLSIVALLVGGGLGVALAYVDVGKVNPALAPSTAPDAPLAVASAGPAAPSRIPRVEVDEPIHDFGTMQRGTSASHEFVFTNTGDGPLRLEVGATSCKCTLGEVAGGPLGPGESTPVKLEWVAKSVVGEFRQTARVKTNDASNPMIELAVEGLVTEVTTLSPQEFLIGRVSADDVAEASVYLATYDDDGPPIEARVAMDERASAIEKYEFSVEPVPVAETPIERAASAVKITVRAGPGLPIGTITEWVQVETNISPDGDRDEPSVVQVPLIAVVEGDVSVHGAGWSKELGLLNLGKVKSAKGRTAKLRLSFKGEHAATTRATLASCDPEWLEVELGEPREVREGVMHQPMEVRVPTGQPSTIRSGPGEAGGGQGEGDARIRLTLDHPMTPELDVKVRFVIAE